VLIEAMATGTPVVALESPGSTDALAQGGGVIVPTREEAFADTVLALLADGPRRRVLGEQAVQAAQRYKISSITARMVDVYEEAIAAGPRLTKKELKRLRDQKHTAEAWREVGNQIRSMGESLSAAFSTAWEGDGEDTQSRRLHDMRLGMEAIIEMIDREIRTGIK